MTKPVQFLTPKARKTRQKLVWAAREIIGRDGAAALNVMQVCDTAKVGRTSFYTYFETAEALLSAVAADAAEEIKQHFDTTHRDLPRGLERLRDCLEMVLRVGVDDPETARLLTALAASGHPVNALLHAEITAELRGAGCWTATRARFLTLSLLACTRDLATGKSTPDDIPGYVAMMMAACR